MRVDDVGRRIASSSGALLWQEAAVQHYRGDVRVLEKLADPDPHL